MIVYHELSSLCADLKLSPRTLYAVSNSMEKHYHTVKIPKKSGGFRKLTVPDELLKMIQRRIADVLLLPLPVSHAASAYLPGRGIKRNAAPHAGKPVLLKMDIYHFFDSVLFRDVKDRAFPAEIYSEPLRVLLATLCYGMNELPQGAPSSPAISNLILYRFDEKLIKICRERGIYYTRYCDDLCFSGDFDAEEMKREVTALLIEEGFFPNRRKTAVLKKGMRQRVTGLVVNERVAVPSDYRRKIRQELYYIRKYGLASHMERTNAEGTELAYLRRLLGRICYCLQINPEDREMQGGKETVGRLIMERNASLKSSESEQQREVRERESGKEDGNTETVPAEPDKDLRNSPKKKFRTIVIKKKESFGEAVSVAEMRRRDAATIAAGTPGRELMYRAAEGIYRAFSGWCSGTVILAGSGNNGGDGFALACILQKKNIFCSVIALSERRTPDSAYYEEQAKALGVPVYSLPKEEEPGKKKKGHALPLGLARMITGAPVIADCLLGTGFAGEVREPYRSAILLINRAHAHGTAVVSADINSGMNGDTGTGEHIVHSDLTVTIGLMKEGLLKEGAGQYFESLALARIGID